MPWVGVTVGSEHERNLAPKERKIAAYDVDVEEATWAMF
jgi:hypothetical protein